MKFQNKDASNPMTFGHKDSSSLRTSGLQLRLDTK
jgi:hypothetical protein